MKNEQKQSRITGLMALVVFGVFAVCILAVLLTGANVYQRLVHRGTQDYDRRTAAQYVTTRIRQADRAGSVTVEDFDGLDALALREIINGETYYREVKESFREELEKILESDGSLTDEERKIIESYIDIV